MELTYYLQPLLITILLRIMYLWYKDTHSDGKTDSWTSFYWKYDQDLWLGTILTIFFYWAVPFEVYLWIASKINRLISMDIDPKQWINFILSVVGFSSIDLFKLLRKYTILVVKKFTNGNKQDN